jgi:ABC-type nitrate/sulfonate/bicarbonate transport system substrate-binding protein
MRSVCKLTAWIAGAAMVAQVTGAFAQQLQQIPIGLSSASFGTAAARIAKEMGLFQKHGLDPSFTVMDSASVATTALISGSIKAALSGPGDLIVAQARGQKIVVVANTYGGLSATLVLATGVAAKTGVRPDASVSERLKALNGLVIAGTSPSSAASVTYKAAAKEAGVDLRYTFMGQQAMQAALESGAIHGCFASAPFWAAPVVKGTAVLWINGPGGEIPRRFGPANAGHVQMMREYAESNPELVRRLRSVFTDFVKALDERPAEVKAAVAKLFPSIDEPTLDLLMASEIKAWKVQLPTVEDMVHEIAFVKASGAPIPNLDSLDPASMLMP